MRALTRRMAWIGATMRRVTKRLTRTAVRKAAPAAKASAVFIARRKPPNRSAIIPGGCPMACIIVERGRAKGVGAPLWGGLHRGTDPTTTRGRDGGEGGA